MLYVMSSQTRITQRELAKYLFVCLLVKISNYTSFEQSWHICMRNSRVLWAFLLDCAFRVLIGWADELQSHRSFSCYRHQQQKQLLLYSLRFLLFSYITVCDNTFFFFRPEATYSRCHKNLNYHGQVSFPEAIRQVMYCSNACLPTHLPTYLRVYLCIPPSPSLSLSLCLLSCLPPLSVSFPACLPPLWELKQWSICFEHPIGSC